MNPLPHGKPADKVEPPAVNVSSEAIAAHVEWFRREAGVSDYEAADLLEALAADRDRLAKTDGLAQLVISEAAEKDATIARLSAELELTREALAKFAALDPDGASAALAKLVAKGE
jgi:hypothetical protein